MIRRKKKITWNDLQSATQKDLKKQYRMGSRDLEVAVRDHLYGANREEMRSEYHKFYGRKE